MPGSNIDENHVIRIGSCQKRPEQTFLTCVAGYTCSNPCKSKQLCESCQHSDGSIGVCQGTPLTCQRGQCDPCRSRKSCESCVTSSGLQNGVCSGTPLTCSPLEQTNCADKIKCDNANYVDNNKCLACPTEHTCDGVVKYPCKPPNKVQSNVCIGCEQDPLSGQPKVCERCVVVDANTVRKVEQYCHSDLTCRSQPCDPCENKNTCDDCSIGGTGSNVCSGTPLTCSPVKQTDCFARITICLLYTSPSPRDYAASRMPSSA